MNRRWLLSLFLLLALALLKRLGRRDPPVATPVTRARPRAAVSSAVSSFDYGLLLRSKKLPSGLVVRIAWQGIAGVVLELLQHLSWRVGSLGAPEIDEDLFAQLPAILGVSERGGQCMLRELVSERASAATAMRSMSTPRRGSATRGIRKVGKASPSRGPPSGHSERQPNLNVLYFPFSETTLH
jgi:hypothetical protein